MSTERAEKYPSIFNFDPSAEPERQKFRPAFGLSDFVVNELPTVLNDIQNKTVGVTYLAVIAEELATVANIRVQRLAQQQDNESLLVARLDVLMLDAAIRKSGGQPGPNFTSLVDMIGELTGRPLGLTYEDVVINNPIDDIRTFTNGEVGISEAGFYDGHRFIEFELEDGVQAAEEILDHVDQMSDEEIAAGLARIVAAIEFTKYNTVQITRLMPQAHFKDGFRRYLGSFKDSHGQEVRGPSGAFTARVPYLEHLFAGETIPTEQMAFLEENLAYFPQAHQSLLLSSREAALNGQSLSQILLQRDAAKWTGALSEISAAFHSFRNAHQGAVQRHIPDVVEGTGGTGLQEFLRQYRERRHGGLR